jgi:hypothetical protein
VGGPPALVERPDLAGHARATFATGVRDEVRCVGPAGADALVTMGRGLGGLTEVGVEIDDDTSGRALLVDALTMVPAGQVVVAAVAPGNARALRSFLAAGFRPVASVQLIKPAPAPAAAEAPAPTPAPDPAEANAPQGGCRTKSVCG